MTPIEIKENKKYRIEKISPSIRNGEKVINFSINNYHFTLPLQQGAQQSSSLVMYHKSYNFGLCPLCDEADPGINRECRSSDDVKTFLYNTTNTN